MREVLALRDFRLLWSSQAISGIADQLTVIALALYVNSIGTPTDVGLVLGSGTLTLVGFVLVGGVWADRLPRARVMAASDLIRALLRGILAVLVLTGEPPVWAIALLEAGFGAARAFFTPAYKGLVPQTVPDALMTPAQALTSLSGTLSLIAGPALGALLFVTVGAGTAFAVDAATFVVSALLLVRVRARDRGGPASRRGSLLQEMGDGVAEVRARPWATAIIGCFALNLLFLLGPLESLGPEVAHQVFGHAALFGVMSAVLGGGLLCGATVALRWTPASAMEFGMYACLLWPAETIVFALGPPLAAVLVFTFLAGVGFGLFDVWWETALARTVPPAALSRVASIDWMGSLALLPVGLLLAGPISSAVGERETLGIGSAIVLVLTFAAARSRWVRAFRYPKSGTPAVGVDASA